MGETVAIAAWCTSGVSAYWVEFAPGRTDDFGDELEPVEVDAALWSAYKAAQKAVRDLERAFDAAAGVRGDPSLRHRPPDFPWPSMDRQWSACYKRQGTTAMDYGDGWSVLSVADRTVDKRPNVLVAFAVQRPDVPEAEMRALAEAHYPTVWARLGTESGPDHSGPPPSGAPVSQQGPSDTIARVVPEKRTRVPFLGGAA